MDWRLENQRIYDNRTYEERRNWDRFHNLLQILNETHTSPYDHLSGNTRGRGHLREDVVRAHLVQGFNLLRSIMFNFGKFYYVYKSQNFDGLQWCQKLSYLTNYSAYQKCQPLSHNCIMAIVNNRVNHGELLQAPILPRKSRDVEHALLK